MKYSIKENNIVGLYWNHYDLIKLICLTRIVLVYVWTEQTNKTVDKKSVKYFSYFWKCSNKNNGSSNMLFVFRFSDHFKIK